MGTSANRDKVRPDSPLIPDWILPPDLPPPEENQEEQTLPEQPDGDDAADEELGNDNDPMDDKMDGFIPNRFGKSQRGFRRAVKGTNIDRGLLTRVLKNYISIGSGGSRTAARRMQRSSSAIARFGAILSNIQSTGLQTELRRLNLSQYRDKPALDVLAAFMDEVCGAGALLDDAVTKQAYVNTIVRIDLENQGLDFGSLNDAQVAEMLAIFLEETIVYRLIADVGRSLTAATSDVQRSLEIEETIYQIVNGLVHAEIVPRLKNSLQNISELNRQIDSIYEVAFNSIIQ